MKTFRTGKCKYCGHTTDLSLKQRICSMHCFDIWFYHKCSHCGKRSWLKRVKGETNNEK